MLNTGVIKDRADYLIEKTEKLQTEEYSGKITNVIGMAVESIGPMVRIGDLCKIYSNKADGSSVYSEVVGIKDNKVIFMPYGGLTGVGAGNRVVVTGSELTVSVGESLKGRILNALGAPLDDKGPIIASKQYPVEKAPPNPLERTRIKEILPTGIRAIDSLLTMGRGQRIGIFAGSGVGKSTLLGMIARRATADINVITLVGERGREVLDFLEKDLKEEGLAKSVLVIATSDQPALLRVKSAMVGTAIAEYFRDEGYNVLLMMDSLTRYAMAQREIGMAVGEPPVSRGFPPSVYSLLPKLLERSGTSKTGSITGIYTVLVEGDDMNEPISDTVRGILDGHFVLSRNLASQNHYPAIDVLASISRLMPDIVSPDQKAASDIIKTLMTTYNDSKDLISIGAYKEGSSPQIDEAIEKKSYIDDFLKQGVSEEVSFDTTVERMKEIAGI